MSRRIKGAGLVGVMVVCVCLFAPIATSGMSSVHKEINGRQDQVVFFSWPRNGIYWNEHRIANYSVPYLLHYHFRLQIAPTLTVNASGVNRVEWWLQGAVQFIDWDGAPFVYGLFVPPHGHSLTLMAEVYLYNGDVYSANITIYRLFL